MYSSVVEWESDHLALLIASLYDIDFFLLTLGMLTLMLQQGKNAHFGQPYFGHTAVIHAGPFIQRHYGLENHVCRNLTSFTI